MKYLKLSTLISLMLLLSFAQIVNAGSISTANINRFNFSCDGTSVSITVAGGDRYRLVISNLDSGASFTTGAIAYSGATTSTSINIAYPEDSFASGERVRIRLVTLSGPLTIAESSRNFTANCDGEGGQAVSNCDDGRININLCEPVAIYPVMDDEGVHMVVYNVERGDDIGEFAFFVDAETLSDVREDTLYPVEIARSEDDFAILYWMPEGHYQVNAGPDFEGKVFTFAFEHFPGQIPTVTTYFSATNEIVTP